jgi:hypothetical protein
MINFAVPGLALLCQGRVFLLRTTKDPGGRAGRSSGLLLH